MIKLQGFAGKNHSWAVTHWNLARAFLLLGKDVDICSTDGFEFFPEDLKEWIVTEPKLNYDIQISYTAMINFHKYLKYGNKNRFGIWNYETTILPTGFAKYYIFTDKILPSSEFSKQIFLENKIPEKHLEVVSHGYDVEAFKTTEIWPLKTKKKYKILANIAQPHLRKNIPGLLEAYGKAFKSKDDVCLVLKVVNKKPEASFEVDFNTIYRDFKSTYSDRGDVEIIQEFIPNIATLYNACDIIFTMSFAECFCLPLLEAMGAGKIAIAPRYGGQLDFMNDDNSVLLPGKIIKAGRLLQYWTASPYAGVFSPNIDDTVDVLRNTVNNYDSLLDRFTPEIRKTAQKFTWENAAKKILEISK